jgi:hypothetical protein
MNIGQIRERLASSVSAVTPSLNFYGYTPDKVAPPCFYSGEVDLAYAGDPRLTFNGEPVVEAVCMLLVSKADDRAGQALLDGYLATTGTSSIKAAVESDKTLAGACKTLHVHHVDGYRLYTVGTDTYYGARFRVIVLGG